MTVDEFGNKRESIRMLMIETHSPWESGDVQDFLELTTAMLQVGMTVRLHLIQNGVIWLHGKATDALRALCKQFAHTFSITSDDMSLDLRGISYGAACELGAVSSIDELVATMADPSVKTIWHS